jgi:hypothetical protein
MCSWRCSCSRNICREKPVFAGKVTSGVRNETSGQSWPSNAVATDPFTGQNRNSKCGTGIEPGFPTSRSWQGPRVRLSVKRTAWSSSTPRALTGNPGQHKRLCGWRPKTFEGSAIIRAGGVDTPIAAGHTRYGTDEMDFDPVCVDDCRTVVCRTQDRAGEGNGYARQLGDRGCARTCLLVRMGGVHTACD